MMKSTVWCERDSLNRDRDTGREEKKKEKELKKKRMWPAVKDDWRGVELAV